LSYPNHPPVLVAVGHDPMGAALKYAADEAARAACGVHLLHVIHPLPQGPEAVLVRSVDLERVGELTLAAAEERARDFLPGHLPLTTELIHGEIVPAVVAAGERSGMIVLQRRPNSRLVRPLTRSISNGVAARAAAPVVSVPTRWSPVRSSDDVLTVAVGVDQPDRSENLLRVGMESARTRRARLRVVHAWTFPGGYDDIIMSSLDDQGWAASIAGRIWQVLALVEDKAEGLDVVVEARHGAPVDALAESAHESELLVIGRHDPLTPVGSHLGPVARAVLQEASCPVLLAGPWPRRAAGTQGTETAAAQGG
jgi:nucleotide-binding universal stress UspA family protein